MFKLELDIIGKVKHVPILTAFKSPIFILESDLFLS